jgi:hypothetical protein
VDHHRGHGLPADRVPARHPAARGDRSAAAGTCVAAGVALSVSWSATAWGAASVLRRERAMGTLTRALAGLVDARLIALGKGLGSALLSNVWALATLAVTLIALRQPVSFATLARWCSATSYSSPPDQRLVC